MRGFAVMFLLCISFFSLANDEEIGLYKKNHHKNISSVQVASEVQRWSAIYTTLISQNLNFQGSYQGQVCKLHVKLHPSGHVKSVTTDSQSLLCNDAFIAVYKVKQFPLPNNPSVDKKFFDFNLSVMP
ncbi:cell envelope integrity protein TolA [Vibrio cincinnatiensis]|uniref:cell envelope integrity protein TolA n=1 Tax=Vibrio cincinnatiensis TaxID=675 RepID=UPI001EDD81FF|nr:cell envelope integrity protein TolA [Vibrio cincinnatiensis]MCG3721387.1 hypothetical protein [Vibrio cincinnatiensis]